MADLKISALTASITPLAGTEVLPIVQSSTTKQVSVANLTAGRAISATQLTLTTGNVIVASGQGVDFSATSGTGTSELLADYEEGTWTPVDGSAASLTFTGVVGRYTKIGQIVTFFADLTYPSTVSVASSVISGLPFASNNALNRTGSVISTTVNAVGAAVPPSTITVLLFPAGSLTPPTNATLSTTRIICAGSYQV